MQGTRLSARPTGTVTFLFTDIDSIAKDREGNPDRITIARTRYEAILRHAIESNGGYAYKIIGEAMQCAFSTAPQALQAALDAQRALAAEDWDSLLAPASQGSQ